MIKINFIASEVAKERNARVRKQAILIYAFAWCVGIFIIFIQVQNDQSVIGAYNKQVSVFKTDIDEVSPQFKQAVQLYSKRNKSKKALGKIYEAVVEPGFILECLGRLADALPANFWLQEVQLSALDKKISADNTKKSGSRKRRMIIRGNLFLNLAAKDSDMLKRFKAVIQESEPFSLAQCDLNLQEMDVKKLANKYSHNFEMAFFWPNEFF